MAFNGFFANNNVPKFRRLAKQEKMFTSGVEVSMVKLFSAKFRRSRFGKAQSLLGINPENELAAMSMVMMLEALEMKFGIGPVRLFPDTRSCFRFGTPRPMFAGRLPES